MVSQRARARDLRRHRLAFIRWAWAHYPTMVPFRKIQGPIYISADVLRRGLFNA